VLSAGLNWAIKEGLGQIGNINDLFNSINCLYI
jgi:hypothetical protein